LSNCQSRAGDLRSAPKLRRAEPGFASNRRSLRACSADWTFILFMTLACGNGSGDTLLRPNLTAGTGDDREQDPAFFAAHRLRQGLDRKGNPSAACGYIGEAV